MTDKPLDRTQAMKSALRLVLTPRMRALGFEGRLPCFRRLGPRGVDVLRVQFRGGTLRLDAGRVPLRRSLGERTVQEDSAVYTAARLAPGVRRSTLDKTAKHRPGSDWFFFDTGQSPRYFVSVANSVVEIVESEGVKFWKRRSL